MVESENKAVFRRFYEIIWNEGDLAAADELLSAQDLHTAWPIAISCGAA
jgi:hypothetical protein